MVSATGNDADATCETEGCSHPPLPDRSVCGACSGLDPNDGPPCRCGTNDWERTPEADRLVICTNCDYAADELNLDPHRPPSQQL